MNLLTARKILNLAIPLLIIAAAEFLLIRVTALSIAHHELLHIAPYLAAVLGMFLAVHFHRGRPFTALMLIALFYYLYRTGLFADISTLHARQLYLSCSLFIPFNFVLIALMRERGILSVAGRLRYGFMLIQIAILWLVMRHFSEDVLPLLSHKFIESSLLDSLTMPQPLLVFSVISLLFMAILTVRRGTPLESGLFGALVALVTSMAKVTSGDVIPVFATAAGIIITLTILQDSYNMAFCDDLTGIPSRRALNEALHSIGRRYVIAMLDVDHFKRFNDTYGHDVGDQVLKMVAKKIDAVSGGGRGFRYGGEEFTIIFSGKRGTDVLPHLEAVRKSIEEYRLAIRGTERPKDSKSGEVKRGSGKRFDEVSVTISIGVAESGEGLRTPAEVIKAADKALYKAKNKGRNQISF